jgi:alginate O-acetyltransferase complex protein AlgJ
LAQFYQVLQDQGVQVLDLTPVLLENRKSEHGPAFCTTDSHWSSHACVLAAQSISQKIAHLLPASLRNPFSSAWQSASFRGDLLDLPGAPTDLSPQETLPVRRVLLENSTPVSPDPESPLLLIGDSHTLVFHDFLAESSGLLDQLAFETALAPDLIGTRGSGATPVRISLLRRSVKDPSFLSKKKVVVWCFSAREFTEAESGWQKVAVSR